MKQPHTPAIDHFCLLSDLLWLKKINHPFYLDFTEWRGQQWSSSVHTSDSSVSRSWPSDSSWLICIHAEEIVFKRKLQLVLGQWHTRACSLTAAAAKVDRLTRDAQIHYLPSSRWILGVFIYLFIYFKTFYLTSLKDNKNQTQSAKLGLELWKEMNILCHESFCKPWYFRDSAWRLLQKRPGGGISKRAKKASEKDGASLRAFVYSCVCLFLSDFYYIFQKWNHWGLKFKRSIKKKQVRLISGSDWPSVWPLLLLVKLLKGQRLGFIHISHIQV